MNEKDIEIPQGFELASPRGHRYTTAGNPLWGVYVRREGAAAHDNAVKPARRAQAFKDVFFLDESGALSAIPEAEQYEAGLVVAGRADQERADAQAAEVARLGGLWVQQQREARAQDAEREAAQLEAKAAAARDLAALERRGEA